MGDLYSFEEGLASPLAPVVVGSAGRSDDLPSAGALPASSEKSQYASGRLIPMRKENELVIRTFLVSSIERLRDVAFALLSRDRLLARLVQGGRLIGVYGIKSVPIASVELRRSLSK